MRNPLAALPLPKLWTRSIQSAVLHVIALAQYALAHIRGQAAENNPQAAKSQRLQQEIALLREELHIKDSRMARIPAHHRPQYQPSERLAILELRAARGWSLAQTARVFQVTTATIASWVKRLDEQGSAALLRTSMPVNKFPQFVRYLVQRLQALCPRMGKVKLAQIRARAGLHLGATTVARMRRESPKPKSLLLHPIETMPSPRRVTAKSPNHVWHVDLTTVPTSAGFWASWWPFALPQCWPFCW